VSATARQWPPPLDRRISLHERDVSLRDALDRLAAAARMHLAYSADLLPLDRRVCATYRSVAAGTRFDQLASGLIQPVAVSSSGPGPGPGGGAGGGGRQPNDGRRIAYQLQNVGEITNRGWDISGSAGARGLSVSSGYSVVDSRVRRLAVGYTGDLRSGDRMLEVPERTLSATPSYARGPWSASIMGPRAYDWVNYDRVALAAAVESNDRLPRDLIGPQLRSFWRVYLA
jgi:iron complex outermembrane receptor protein